MEIPRIPDEESLRNYHDLKAQLESALIKVKSAKELREAKGFLIEVQGRFKGLKLMREQREELYGRLQEAFGRVNQAIEDERATFQNDAQLNYFMLKPKIEEAGYRADHPGDLKETWDFLINIQNEFRGIRLHREQREELYGKLQAAFDKIKFRKQEAQGEFERKATERFPEMKTKVESVVSSATENPVLRAAKEQLIAVQLELREAQLTREQRDQLYNRLQEGFVLLKIRQEEAETAFETHADSTYDALLPRIREAVQRAETVTEFKPVRETLKAIQTEMKESPLRREQREELYRLIQQAFDLLALRQDEANSDFEHEAKKNYDRLRPLIEQGLKQAEETHQYKETREFLKKIQSEFKGIRLKHEQREELYSRLQTAFDVLGKRLDEYFRQKKKNWMVRMEYNLASLETELYALEEQIRTEQEVLTELEDQLEIRRTGSQEPAALRPLTVRIESARREIHEKELLLEQKRQEYELLENKLKEPEEEG